MKSFEVSELPGMQSSVCRVLMFTGKRAYMVPGHDASVSLNLFQCGRQNLYLENNGL